MGNKNVERKCLEFILRYKPQCEFGKNILKNLINYEINETEKPDFIINKIGIEHFLADLFFTTKKNKAMSIERKNASTIVNKINYYKNNPNDLNKDIKNGKTIKFIENIANSQINMISNFSFQKFICNYEKMFRSHYKNRNEYRKKCDKLGFLIEIPYMNIGEDYLITKGQDKYYKSITTIPIPKKLINYIWEHNDLDFVILCVRPINITNEINRKNVSVIYINPKVEKLSLENTFLCDEFNYVYKFINENVLKLSIKNW